MDKPEQPITKLINYIGIEGWLGIILVLLLYIAATKPENFKIYFGFIFQLIANPFKFLRKRAIRFQIEGPTTRALKKVAKEINEIEIPDLSIEWVSEDNLSTKLKEGKAIIKLKFENDNSKNIIKATSIYVKDAFLKHSKIHFTDSLKKAIELVITKKILLNITANKSNLVTQFFEENSSESEEIFEKSEKIEEIDDSGLLTRILIREFNSFGNKLLGRIPKIEYKEESDKFMNFVNQIATREYDDYTPLTFVDETIKVGIVLVAKEETYIKHGINAYLRRIKLGRAQGIETFYLLARSEKVSILQKVAKELLESGNFILINKPYKFKDRQNREAVCYYIKINEDSLFANTIREIGDSINSKSSTDAVVTSVKEDYIEVDVNGVEGFIKQENLSVLEIKDSRLYFREGQYIDALPLEIQKDGIVEFSLKGTKSDPNHLVTSRFKIGDKVFGKVKYIDDDFIKVDLGAEQIEGFSYRNDLTKSRFVFLHKKFNIGDEYEFEILGYNFEKACVKLKLSDLKDPWEQLKYTINQEVNLHVCKKSQRAFIGEIEEGIDAVLNFGELGWTKEQINIEISKIKLDSFVQCKIKVLDKVEKLIILTRKIDSRNPYIEFIQKNKGSIQNFRVIEIGAYGITGQLSVSNLDIHIPKFEISWNGDQIKHQVGNIYEVYIKDIDKNKSKLIGTFKPLIKHPLKDFESHFQIGQVLKNLKVFKNFNAGLIYSILYKNQHFEGVLFKGEISQKGWVEDLSNLSHVLSDLPLEIKEIDLEKNLISLSLKKLTLKNRNRQSELSYESSYSAIVLGKQIGNSNNYAVLIPLLWVEGILETNKSFESGDKVDVRPIRKSEEYLILTDDE